MNLMVHARKNVYKGISIYGFKTEFDAKRFAHKYGGKAFHFENCKPLSNGNSVEFEDLTKNDINENE